MQWIVEHQIILAFLVSVIGVSVVSRWWTVQKMQREMQTLRSELDSQIILTEQKVQYLEQSLSTANKELEEMDSQRDLDRHELKQTHGKFMAVMEKLRYLDVVESEKKQLMQELSDTREQKANLAAQYRELQALHKEQLQNGQDKIQFLENAENRLKQQFESLATQLFELKAAKVDQQNKQSLEGLLNPLKDQLDGFRKQVNDSFSQEAKERHTLVHELKTLQTLNEKMAQEAVNLTQALKGDNKQQGNWGEVVLARVLEESGLRDGHEYMTQVSLQNESGKRYQPDVVVFLPNNKQVVIDSKMTLVAYERYFHAETETQKATYLSEHLLSVRGHIKGLSRKDYQQLQGITSLDYVLMFIPVEPAFQLAVQADPSLVKDAMEQNIILVSPTTLLVALRTIDNLWKNERQNQNAKLIAEKASKLYDKLRLFVDDMDSLGMALDKANQNYQGAMNKLVSGRGNAIRQAESFRELGVEVKRPISAQVSDLSQRASSDEEM
ncbi:DNA recombination protein RmuC [Vibrio salinus]|uniref:DNA recombination protein RmuC n=1 Tax=Vibrio salinus TaxID=2899784 RepID=UPI001E30216D|nr:DNA recombination protein RmuC [Vibrio salinus]MCE0493572.1 DNA recombination protein RmuC [Vibrio salinus]